MKKPNESAESLNRPWIESFLKDGQFESGREVKDQEKAETFNLEVAMPGLRKEDISAAVHFGCLKIYIKKPEESADQSGTNEGEHTEDVFYRSFNLPDNADEDHIRATFRDGVLKIKIRKLDDDAPKVKDIKID